jgi:hypothetical protein
METKTKNPITTNCNCGKLVTMIWNGNWHSVDCNCGRNIRQKGATLIIELNDNFNLK